jgi:hypothetical protein
MIEAYNVLKDFGFPAFLVLVLLMRFERTIDRLVSSVEAMHRAIIAHGIGKDDDR